MSSNQPRARWIRSCSRRSSACWRSAAITCRSMFGASRRSRLSSGARRIEGCILKKAVIDKGDRLADGLAQGFRARRQCKSIGATHQEVVVQQCPETLHRVADGRLRAPEPFAGARDVAFGEQRAKRPTERARASTAISAAGIDVNALLKADGALAFSNAEILVPEAEHKFWMDEPRLQAARCRWLQERAPRDGR